MNAAYVKIGDSYYAPGCKEAKAHAQSMAGLGAKVVKPSPKCEVKMTAIPTPEEALNKTERRYLDILRERFPNRPIMIQSITLRVAHNTKYTPDFAYSYGAALMFVEVKGGFVRDDAIVKLKTAANKFPQFTFIKAQYKKGKWIETVVPK